jgi:hypothetical protein
VIAALVAKRELIAPQCDCLIRRIEALLPSPVMLIAKDESNWAGALVYAQFDADPFFYALLQARDIDWCELLLPECEPAI